MQEKCAALSEVMCVKYIRGVCLPVLSDIGREEFNNNLNKIMGSNSEVFVKLQQDPTSILQHLY